MRYFILSFFSLFLHTGVDSQDIHVKNARTGDPVEGVLVITQNHSALQTDEEGMVNLGEIGGKEIMLFQHASFLKFRTTKEKILSRDSVVLLVEDPVRLDEIVVSVNRWEQSKAEVPLKIKTLTATDVWRNNPQTAADMLKIDGGVFIQKSQMGGGSPMIRGFAANRVLIVVDGIRMNNAIFRSGNLHNVISLDVNALESTEVIYGPGSVLYGSDALGGVMSFNTLIPKRSTSNKREQKVRILTRYSSANFEKTVHGDFNIGSEKWAAVISSTWSGFGDLRMGGRGPEEYLRGEYVVPGDYTGIDMIAQNDDPRLQKFTGYNQFNVLSKVRFNPNEKTDLILSARHSRTSDIPRYDRLIVRRNGELRYGDWYYGPQKWSLFSGQFKYKGNHLLFDKLNALTGFQLFTESRHDRSLNSGELRNREEDLEVLSLNLDLAKTISDHHAFFYGAEVLLNYVGSEGNIRHLTSGDQKKIASRYPDGSEYQSFAGYISYKVNFSEQLILQAGSRFTHTLLKGHFDPDFYAFPFQVFDMENQALNGNLGFVWHPSPEWQFNLGGSTGFRSPNIDDVAKVFDSEPGNVIVPNPGLKPEYSRNIELGIIRSYPGKARIDLSAFYTRLKNAMVRRDFTLNGEDSILYDGLMSKVEALVNAESADILGGSVSFEYLFNSSLKTRNDFTITFGEDADGKPLRHVPPAFGSSHLIFGREKWFVDFFAEYCGSLDYEELASSEKDKPHLYAMDDQGRPWSPGWWTMNLQGGYNIRETVALNGGVENMLNKRYRRYSSGIVSPGINFVLSLRITL